MSLRKASALALFGLLMLRRTTEGRGVVGFVDVALAIGGVLGANALGLGVMWVLVNLLSAVHVLTAADAETLQLIQIGLIVLGFMALGMMIPGMWSGWLQDEIGYVPFFVWVLVATVPSVLMAALIKIPDGFGKKADDTP